MSKHFFVPLGTKQSNLIQGNYNLVTTKDDLPGAVQEILKYNGTTQLVTEFDSHSFELLMDFFDYIDLSYQVVVGIPEVDALDSFLRVTDYEKVVNYTSIMLEPDSAEDKAMDKFAKNQEDASESEVDVSME